MAQTEGKWIKVSAGEYSCIFRVARASKKHQESWNHIYTVLKSSKGPVMITSIQPSEKYKKNTTLFSKTSLRSERWEKPTHMCRTQNLCKQQRSLDASEICSGIIWVHQEIRWWRVIIIIAWKEGWPEAQGTNFSQVVLIRGFFWVLGM